jgi:hypothetical protein
MYLEGPSKSPIRSAVTCSNVLGLALGDQHRDGANDVGRLALEVADPRLARVAVDDLRQRGEDHLLLRQAVLLELLGDEELLRDVQLLLAREDRRNKRGLV